MMKCQMDSLLSFTVLLFIVTSLYSEKVPRLGKDSIQEVIAAMTLEEKTSLVVGTGMDFPGLPPEMRGPVVGESQDKKVPGAAGTTHAIPRLGIPSIVLADGPAGLRIKPNREDTEATFYCTAFPIATQLASTWNRNLVEYVGRCMGNEVKEYGVDIILGPALNIHRIPLGGRNFEYFSEDPLVTGKMAAALVQGIQSQGVGTSIKHFVANNHEWNRNTINVIVSERALREIYLRGFEIAVRECQPWTVMSSYNKVNGTYTSESIGLLKKILRNDWDFSGLVMSDWFAGRDAVAQMKARNDLLMPGTDIQKKALIEAVQTGTLDEQILDQNIADILNIIVRSPSFNHYKYSNQPDLDKHAQVCREAAAEGMVLLKNDRDVLPLKAGVKIAVYGNAAYEIITGGTGSGDVNEAYSVSLIQGLEHAGLAYDKKLSDTYIGFIDKEKAAQPPMKNSFMLPPPIAELKLSENEIQKECGKTDLALVVLGRNSGEFKDRELENDFYLSETEKMQLQRISGIYHEANKPVVVILNIGGVIETASWRELADAVLLAWQPGQEAGHAISDILTGKVNPSGKLATTFPMDYPDVPASSNFPGKELAGPDPAKPNGGAQASEIVYKDDIWVGYRYYLSKDIEAAYPFGFGLSYTDFEYSPITLNSKFFKDQLTVKVTVKNTGKNAGKEVVQLYIAAPARHLIKPIHELKGFNKTNLLEPGESQTLTWTLSPRDLCSFDSERSAWIAASGLYQVGIGSSSVQMNHTETFHVQNELIVEEVSRALIPDKAID